ncbi:PIN domain-containing protein [Candidatus Micrarchaeota archaeon]|nr:PIN domain-containing protein [Candidatus Micrarchaeota archaeon]
MTGTKILFDTSAIIEMLLGSREGETVKEHFSDPNTQNLVPAIVLCELVSKLKRSEIYDEKKIEIIEKNSTVLELNKSIAKKAGHIHYVLKKKEPRISTIDCIIMAHADEEGAIILTKDHHFLNFKNTELIGEESKAY